MIRVSADGMQQLVDRTFRAAGCPDDEAGRIALYLTRANLTGHDSHGVIRVPRYSDWMREGRVFPGKHIETVLDGGSFLILDGCHGFGQTVGPEATARGIERARDQGLALVALRRAGHLGRIGDFAEMAIDAGLVSVHFVNVHNSLLVAPFGGRERRFSTNPIAIGFPASTGHPFVLDFATSFVAEGKVLVAHQGGKPIPTAALVDADGNQTNDTTALYGAEKGGGYPDPRNGPGAIRTFGEHKGSGLALACELLAGALTGSGVNTGPEGTIHNGMLSIFIDPGRFDTDGRLTGDVEDFMAWIRSCRPETGAEQVLLPGDKERQTRAEREANGLPIAEETLQAIIDTATGHGIERSDIDRLIAT